jgi:hypothetical protein
MPAKNKYALSIEKKEPNIWRLFCSRLINSRDIRHLTQEMRLVPDGFKTFFNRDVVVYLIPTPCMMHVGMVESFVSDVCHSCKPELECGRQRIRAGGP